MVSTFGTAECEQWDRNVLHVLGDAWQEGHMTRGDAAAAAQGVAEA